MSHGHFTKVTLLYFLLALSFLSCERVCSVLGSESSSVRETHSIHEDNVRKEMIKVQILQRLGLSEKPQMGSAHKLSKDLALEILRRTDKNLHQSSFSGELMADANSTQTEDDNNLAKTSEILSIPDKGPILNGHTLLSFSYAGNNAYGMGVRVKKAHLWVKMDYRSFMGKHFGHLLHPKGVNLYIFHITGSSNNAKKNALNHTNNLTSLDVQMDLVVSRTILLDSLGWQKLDITPVVQKWYNKNSRHRIRHQGKNHHKEKLTILVDCAGCANSIYPITFSQSNTVITENNNSEHQRDESGQHLENADNAHLETSEDVDGEDNETPFLVIETETAPASRRNRRRALECGPRVKHCCKQRFYVSFQELGWDDWIIAPKGYYANYCRGHCGGPFRTPDTFLNYHTHVMEEYRRTAEGQANLEGITPCCAPTKFAPMSLIYFNNENVIKRDIPKMIVLECGCP